MVDLSDVLWQVWLLYWLSASLIGSFIGTLLAFGARALWRKLTGKGVYHG